MQNLTTPALTPAPALESITDRLNDVSGGCHPKPAPVQQVAQSQVYAPQIYAPQIYAPQFFAPQTFAPPSRPSVSTSVEIGTSAQTSASYA
jgi:hypothetical protein